MPWITDRWGTRWVEEEEPDWLQGYEKGPGLTPRLDPLVQIAGTIYPGGADPNIPNLGYNPTLDASIINESITTQAPAPASTTTSLFSMPAPYQRYTAPRQQVRYMAPRTQMMPTPQPQRMMPPLNIPGRLPAPVQQPIYDRGPQMQPTMPPPPRPPEFQPFPPPQPPVRPPFINPPPIVRPPRPPIVQPPPPPIVQPPPPPERDTGAADRARRLAQQKARAANKRARDLAKQKAAVQRERDLAGQKRAAANKRARDKAEATRQRGRGGPTPPPATRPGRTQEGKGPKGARTITGVARSQNTQRGDR